MLRIAIADCLTYDEYERWLRRLDDSIRGERLSYRRNNLERIRECDGLVLTGGGDVHPDFYRRNQEEGGAGLGNGDLPKGALREKQPLINRIDRKRDEFELRAIDEALKIKIPLLAICRGLQIGNVYFGGTLIEDLKEKNKIHAKEEDADRRHRIVIQKDSLLMHISGVLEGEVNSTHHQAANLAGDPLIVSARSLDGVIEALELKEKAGSEFLLFIQWHPERMKDTHNPLSRNIGNAFISYARARQKK